LVAACLVLLLVPLGASTCTPATVHVLDWGVLDHTTSVETDVPNGGSLTITLNDVMIVTFRVKDPLGIKSLSIWADGMFQCETADRQWQTQFPVSAGVARSDVTLPTTDTNGFIQAKLVYHDLDCGVHHYANMASSEDFTAFSGTLHFHGSETDINGNQSTATLDLTP
jgi:hypothetical protein